jgi:uncharacterized protein YcfJ
LYKNKLFLVIVALVLSSSLAVVGCANRAQTGAVIGAATGGLLGAEAGQWVVGAGIGAALGYIIGNEWDKRDESMARQAVRTNQRMTWNSRTANTTFTAVPGDTYVRNGVKYKNVTVLDEAGRQKNVTMRQNVQGNWEVVN